MSAPQNALEFFKNIEQVSYHRVQEMLEGLKNTAALTAGLDIEPGILSTVNGIMVPDPERAEAEAANRYETRQAYLDNYQASSETFDYDRDTLRANLTAVGITPLAILPIKLWDELRKRYGLYQFTFDENGRTGASFRRATHTNRTKKEIWRFNLRIYLGTWLVPEVLAILLGVNFWDSVIVGFTASILGWFFLAVISEELLGKILLYKNPEDYNEVAKWYDRKPHRQKLRELFPDFASVADSETKLSVVFPEPPAEVATIIRKLRNKNIAFQVVAEPDAIAFNPPLWKQLQESFEAERLRWRERYEPIIQVPEGTAVAIVAQYGPFALEQQAVESAIRATDPLGVKH